MNTRGEQNHYSTDSERWTSRWCFVCSLSLRIRGCATAATGDSCTWIQYQEGDPFADGLPSPPFGQPRCLFLIIGGQREEPERPCLCPVLKPNTFGHRDKGIALKEAYPLWRSTPFVLHGWADMSKLESPVNLESVSTALLSLRASLRLLS